MATAIQTSRNAITVTPDNFCRAETDLYFSGMVRDGGFGKFFHNREPRLYRPRAAILNGTWKFPEPQPLN